MARVDRLPPACDRSGMRRTQRLTSRLARFALAYALAVQTLLGAWIVQANAIGAIDSSQILCRTAASDPQPSRDDTAPAAHCVMMCVSGACGAGEPPTVAGADIEFAPLRLATTSTYVVGERLPAASTHIGLSARGPPSIA